MNWILARLSAAAATVAMIAPLSGCFVAADLLNPAAIAQFGFDPSTIQRPVGAVIVVFVNDTDQQATFSAFRQSDVTDVTTAKLFQVTVDPNSNANEVLDCPTTRISLGSPTMAGAAGANASVTVGTTAVNFTGDAVLEGRDYMCGDVIEYRVSVVPGGDPAANFVVTARVQPGR